MRVVLLGATPPPIGGIAKWTERMLQAKRVGEWEIDLIDEKMLMRDCFGDNTKKNFITEYKRWRRIWLSLWKKTKEDDVIVNVIDWFSLV